jgi:RNA polymerase sigma-70 factor (ECF subfamily)
MTEDEVFADFIRRIRAGDAQAAAELLRQYEPVVRLEVRLRLSDRRLRRVFDSMDICQSVMASFFVRAAAGQYDLEQPGELVHLLVGMARNKLAFQVRRERAQRRDNRRVEVNDHQALHSAAAATPSPSEVVASDELLQRFRQKLSAEERQLAELRAEGLGWIEVAARVGGTPQGRRKQLERAVERVAGELGLSE